MRNILAAVWMGLFGLVPAAFAQEHPVVVELYTSQGCSSCPPADALLAELALREDVIALALHVDYWDYIGWKDSFASPENTRRQRAYARAAGQRMVYTPQMIVDGEDHVVGYKPMQLAKLIQDHAAAPMPLEISAVRNGDSILITADAAREAQGDMVVQLVRYTPSSTVNIRGGENAGKTIDYKNIVTEWRVLGGWNGVRPLEMRAEAVGDSPVVIVLQKAGHGPILAAARLR